MEQGKIFITNLKIEQVRHLKGLSIPFSQNQMKHLILTEKNGSGKTSVAEAMAKTLDYLFSGQFSNAATRISTKKWSISRKKI